MPMHAAGLAAIRNAEIRSTYHPLVVQVFDLTTEQKLMDRNPLSLVTVDKVMRVCAATAIDADADLADVDPEVLPVDDAQWIRYVCEKVGYPGAGPFARRIPTLVVAAWRRAAAELEATNR